jgi:hypothetical protein
MWLYILILILIVYYLTKNRSSFENIQEIYQQQSCGKAQGNLPGSEIIFSDAEKRNLNVI